MINKNKLFKVFGLFLLFFNLEASEIFLKKGQARTFKTNENISTVFTSNPKALDYKIINNKEVLIYAIEEGLSNLKIFGGENSKIILDLDFFVSKINSSLEEIARFLEEKNPNSRIKIDRLGEEGYVLSGLAQNEESKESIYKMAAVALGLTVTRNDQNTQATNAQSTSNQSNQQGQNAQAQLEFLEKVKNENLINKIKVYGKSQVNVKLLVADVEKNLIQKLGIDWNSGGIFKLANINTYINPIRFNNNSRAILNFSSVINAIKNDSVAKILAQPNLSVLSGEEASFKVTGEYTPFTNTIGPTGQVVSSPASAREYGISLSIKPKISSNDKIQLTISQEVSNIQNIVEVGTASAANLKTRRANSVIEVANGESFIIGGLLDERDNETVNSIPFLGDIPYLGAAFRKSVISKTKSELIIVATVSLTKGINPQDIQIPTFDTRSITSSLFNIKENATYNENRDLRFFMNNSGFIIEPIFK